MRIVIPSHNRSETITTHLLFKGFDYYIFVHDQEQYQKYLTNPTIEKERLICTGADYGVASQRNWIQDNFLAKDEWYLSLDDNIEHVSAVKPEAYNEQELDVEKKETKELYNNHISGEQFLSLCEEMIEVGEKIKAYNLGFAVMDNFYFRAKKYRYVGYVISKAVIRKNVGIRFTNGVVMDDYEYTAECLLQHGKVLINNFIYPHGKHYQKGGIGTYWDRVPKKRADCEFLMNKYPGLFRYKIKAGCDPKAELAIRFTDSQQVEKWRFWMRNCKGK